MCAAYHQGSAGNATIPTRLYLPEAKIWNGTLGRIMFNTTCNCYLPQQSYVATRKNAPDLRTGESYTNRAIRQSEWTFRPLPGTATYKVRKSRIEFQSDNCLGFTEPLKQLELRTSQVKDLSSNTKTLTYCQSTFLERKKRIMQSAYQWSPASVFDFPRV